MFYYYYQDQLKNIVHYLLLFLHVVLKVTKNKISIKILFKTISHTGAEIIISDGLDRPMIVSSKMII